MSLQVWLPLNGNLNNQGLMDIKTITAGSPTYTDGKMGKAVKSFGYTLKAESVKQILNNKELTIAFWVYVDLDEGSTDNRVMFFGIDSMTSLGGRQFSLFNYPTSNDFHWSWQNCVNGEYTMVSSGVLSGVIPTRTWTHIAVTYNNPNGKIYINGVEKKSFSGQYKTDSFEFDTPVIRQSDYYRYNDYRIYDHCLSPKEVKELSKGLCLHYKLNGSGLHNPNLMANTGFVGNFLTGNSSKTGWLNLPLSGDEVSSEVVNSGVNSIHRYRTGTSATTWSELQYYQRDNTTLSVGKTYTFSVWVYAKNGDWLSTSANTFWSSIRIYNSSGTIIKEIGYADLKPSKADIWERRSVTFTIPSSCADYSWWYLFFTIPRDVDVYFSQPKLEEGSVATPWCPNSSDNLYSVLGYDDAIEYDTSGFRNNGTKVGVLSINQDSPRYNCSYRFNGTDYIKSSLSETVSQVSCSFWIKPSSLNGGYAIIASNYSSPSSGFWIASNCEGSGLWFYTGTYARCNAKLNNDVWYHGCFTFNKGICKWYLNGELNSTTDISSTKTSLTISNISIGNSYTGSSWNTKQYGCISDFRLYNTVLSPEDIKELYNTPVSITNSGALMTQGEVVE